MDQSIHICIVSGPYIATHEPSFCPICGQELHAGDAALTIDNLDTVCRPCGLSHLDDLLGRIGPLQD